MSPLHEFSYALSLQQSLFLAYLRLNSPNILRAMNCAADLQPWVNRLGKFEVGPAGESSRFVVPARITYEQDGATFARVLLRIERPIFSFFSSWASLELCCTIFTAWVIPCQSYEQNWLCTKRTRVFIIHAASKALQYQWLLMVLSKFRNKFSYFTLQGCPARRLISWFGGWWLYRRWVLVGHGSFLP